MALVGSLVVSLTANTAPFQQGIGQATNAVKQVQQTVATAQGTITGLERSLMGLAAQYIGLNQLVGAMRSLVEAGRQMELLRITAANVFGGTQEGGQAIEQMSALAERLGINFQQLVRGYTNVTAASRGTKVEGEDTRRMFEQLVSITRALGQSSDQTAGSILAVQQILTKGTIMAEEFRGQLGERLPGIIQAGAKTMGVSLESFSKMMERGELGARALVNIINTMFQDVGRKADTASNSFDAALARMQTAWTKLGESLTQGGFGIALKWVVGEVTGVLKMLEEWNRMLPGGVGPPTPAVAAMGRDVPTNPKDIPAVRELDAIGKKSHELMKEFMNLQRIAKTVIDPGDLANVNARLNEMRAAIIATNEAYRAQEAIVAGIVEQSIGSEVGQRIDQFAKQTAENQVNALKVFLEQAESLLTQFDNIRNDTRRRAEMVPTGKEFFARDALSDSKKLLDTISSLVARLREMVSITPNVPQAMRDALQEVEARARGIPQFRQEQQGIITSLEQMEDLYRRIGRIREENAQMTMGREEAQVNAEARARQLQLEMEAAKKQFLLDPQVGTAMAQSALDFALADQQRLIGDAARTTISEFRRKEFEELHAKLQQQIDDLHRGTQSWAEIRAAVADFPPELQKILDLDLDRISLLRELNQLSEDNATRERALSDIYEGLADDLDRLNLSEEELLRKRLARARAAPMSRMAIPQTAETLPGMRELFARQPAEDAAMIQGLRDRQEGEFAQRKRERDLQNVESMTSLIVAQHDEIRTLSMTRQELLEYELALYGATEGQKALARTNFEMTKQLNGARDMADFVIDAFEDLAFRGELNFQKLAQSFTQMVFRIGIQALELDKHLAKLFAKGIELGLSLLGGAAGVSTTANAGAGGVDFPGASGGLGITGGGDIPGGQRGGLFFAGQPLIAGEAGPELILPTVPGVVMTAPQTRALMGSTVPPNVTFNIYAMDAPSVIQGRGAISRALLSAVREAQRTL